MSFKTPNTARRTQAWMGLKRGHRARPLEWMIEQLIQFVSYSAIIMVFLIFIFVTREALPILLGQMDSAAVRPSLSMDEAMKLPEADLRKYLNMTQSEFAKADAESIKMLVELRIESSATETTDKDAKLNTTQWSHLLGPYQWSGYTQPEYIWQPVGTIHKYNIVPLLVGSLKVSFIALAFALPLALGAAIYVSQLANPRIKEWLKPAIELLAGLPSVVLGFFAMLVMATFLQSVFGYTTRLNAFLAGIALGLAVIPLVFSIAEDALTSVPRSYTQAALALGSSRWQAAYQIVLPAALPGVFAAAVLGFGRALGETMIVLMTSSASIISWNIFDSARPITASIAAELAEAVFGGHHYRILFMLGALLFTVTFLLNLIGDVVVYRLKRRLEGKA